MIEQLGRSWPISLSAVPCSESHAEDMQSTKRSNRDVSCRQRHGVGKPTISLLLRRIMPDAVRVASEAIASRRNDALRACSTKGQRW